MSFNKGDIPLIPRQNKHQSPNVSTGHQTLHDDFSDEVIDSDEIAAKETEFHSEKGSDIEPFAMTDRCRRRDGCRKLDKNMDDDDDDDGDDDDGDENKGEDSSNIKHVVIGAAAGVGAIVAAPLVLSAVGFTAAGVAAGSIAAALQTPFTVAGGWFASCQSAGVLGLAVSTKLGIGAAAGGAAGGVSKLWSTITGSINRKEK